MDKIKSYLQNKRKNKLDNHPNDLNYTLLNKEWFIKHQKFIINLFKFPLIGLLLKLWCGFGIHESIYYIDHGSRHYFNKKKKVYAANFYASMFHSKVFSRKFKWIFLAMHYLDKIIDPMIPELSFGFELFTEDFYSDDTTPGLGTAIDGYIIKDDSNQTWNDLRNWSVNTDNFSKNETSTSLTTLLQSTDGWAFLRWDDVSRIYISFDFSSFSYIEDMIITNCWLNFYVASSYNQLTKDEGVYTESMNLGVFFWDSYYGGQPGGVSNLIRIPSYTGSWDWDAYNDIWGRFLENQYAVYPGPYSSTLQDISTNQYKVIAAFGNTLDLCVTQWRDGIDLVPPYDPGEGGNGANTTIYSTEIGSSAYEPYVTMEWTFPTPTPGTRIVMMP